MESCCHPKPKRDWLLIGTAVPVALLFMASVLCLPYLPSPLADFAKAVDGIVHQVWWGVLLGMVSVGFMSLIPREIIIGMLGRKGGANGIARAVAAGFFFDLCSHGIVMVGAKLYERGATLGQTFAFLISSPWNSISLTLIMLSLIGWQWTLSFILLSALIAFITGLVVEKLVSHGHLPTNPNRVDLPADFNLARAFHTWRKTQVWNTQTLNLIATEGWHGSKMVLKWLMLGVLITAAIQAFVPHDWFTHLFGPTLVGLGFTLLLATVVEVCSEGNMPLGADILTRAAAPGNAFAYLMTGVATDYLEIMVLKNLTNSWKVALALPLITVPQVVVVAIILNNF